MSPLSSQKINEFRTDDGKGDMMASASNTHSSVFYTRLYCCVPLLAGEVSAWATLLDQGRKLPAA